MVERGEVANSWRNERWDSLRLLTPNWQSGLPGLRYEGADPDGYMSSYSTAWWQMSNTMPRCRRNAMKRTHRAHPPCAILG